MATRRPRLKITANLTARRSGIPANRNKSTTPSTGVDSDTELVLGNSAGTENVQVTDINVSTEPVSTITSSEQDSNIVPTDFETEGTCNSSIKPAINESKSIRPRKLLRPPVNIPIRKKKPDLCTDDNHKSVTEESTSKSVHSIVNNLGTATDEELKSFQEIEESEISDPVVSGPILCPNENDENNFKSPQVYGFTSTKDSQSTAGYSVIMEDLIKSPFSPGRPRVRPTPCFRTRRNSTHTSSEDEQPPKRKRLYSNESVQIQSILDSPSNRLIPPTRTRTESSSSNMSEIGFKDFINRKLKRITKRPRPKLTRELKNRIDDKPPDKTRLTMQDMIYYNPVTNPMKNISKTNKSVDGSVKGERISISSVKTESSPPPPPIPPVDLNEEIAMPVPQLKLGPNGEIILDEKSLVIETTGKKQAREALAKSDIVYDDEFSSNTGFYSRQKRTRDWPPEETIKFYRCLHTIGTDFSCMVALFPKRSRKDLKAKFKKEEKCNSRLINKALLHPKEFDIDELKGQLEAAEIEQEEQFRKWKEFKAKEKKSRNKTLKDLGRQLPTCSVSKTMRDMLGGDIVYEYEVDTLKKPKKPKNPRIKNETDFPKTNIDIKSQDRDISTPSNDRPTIISVIKINKQTHVGDGSRISLLVSDKSQENTPEDYPTKDEESPAVKLPDFNKIWLINRNDDISKEITIPETSETERLEGSDRLDIENMELIFDKDQLITETAPFNISDENGLIIEASQIEVADTVEIDCYDANESIDKIIDSLNSCITNNSTSLSQTQLFERIITTIQNPYENNEVMPNNDQSFVDLRNNTFASTFEYRSSNNTVISTQNSSEIIEFDPDNDQSMKEVEETVSNNSQFHVETTQYGYDAKNGFKEEPSSSISEPLQDQPVDKIPELKGKSRRKIKPTVNIVNRSRRRDNSNKIETETIISEDFTNETSNYSNKQPVDNKSDIVDHKLSSNVEDEQMHDFSLSETTPNEAELAQFDETNQDDFVEDDLLDDSNKEPTENISETIDDDHYSVQNNDKSYENSITIEQEDVSRIKLEKDNVSSFQTPIPVLIENSETELTDVNNLSVEDDDDNDDGDDFDLGQSKLVLITSEDRLNPSKLIYEIYVMSPNSGTLSEEPLDLTKEEVEEIRLSLS